MTTTAQQDRTPGVVELVPGRLFLLGDDIALDGRISWVPADARGWQPSNCYALVEPGGVVVVDPGPRVLDEVVCAQLQTLLPPGTPLSVFLTRAELDTTGGLGALARAFPIARLYAGGGPNPFDSFEAAGDVQLGDRRERIQLERMPAGAVPVGPGRGLQVLPPSIRLLATWWGYDEQTQTLFTSDSFTHTCNEVPGGPRVLDGTMPPQADPDRLRSHLTAKFAWLRHAKTPALWTDLQEVFRERPVARIAPGHGLVLEGEDVVQQHVAAVLDVLKDLAA
ncbi:MAG: hypothetical protein JWN17_2328 [Frankiales bacterium]|nr:hypothetical protein [Frankiales bacterium]